MKYFLYRSKNNPDRSITIGLDDEGYLFLPSAEDKLSMEQNRFNTIEEIETILDDKLEMLRPIENE